MYVFSHSKNTSTEVEPNTLNVFVNINIDKQIKESQC